MLQQFKYKILGFAVAAAGITAIASSYANKSSYRYRPSLPPLIAAEPAADSTKKNRYPVKERTGDFVTGQPKDPFYLKDPANVKQTIEYDPASGQYILSEKIGDQNYRPPTYLTYDEYLKFTEKQERESYWKSRSNALGLVEDKGLLPPIQVKNKFFDKLFGGSKIEIRPQGNLEMLIGANYQTVANPNIPIRNRRTGGFDFDLNINVNVIGKIGDKIQLGVRYNTQSGFDFENQLKLEYAGDEDDIIKKIEAGNVSMTLPTRLIQGSQTLFGFKTTLQFGRLTWTSLVSQQKSKRESVVIESGAQRQNFEVKSDQYEDNRHYFLGQYFRNQYDFALSDLPVIKSNVNITRIEVWVTNRIGATQGIRDVVALADLGEIQPYSPNVQTTAGGDGRARNEANNLYQRLVADPNTRFVDKVVGQLSGPSFGLQQGQDFDKTFARKLEPRDFTYNPQLGYLSLNTLIQPNEVLAVAYQYEFNGEVFQIGEFANQIPPDSSTTSKALFVKMLKGYSIRPTLPIWDLMMKNIYSLGAYQVSNEEFRLDILYNDPGGGEKRYMPRGNLKGIPIIRVLNLDNVNMFGDPQPDGLFDFLPGTTILAQNGRLIFPVKEPFGSNLRQEFIDAGNADIADQFTYQQLYDSTKFRAQQFPEFNRFIMRGQYKGVNNSEIRIGFGNVPQGSVIVSAGGQRLVEETDYTVEYTSGIVRIINPSILNSGQRIQIDFENNNQFGVQQRTMFGTRLDYRVNPKLNIGATVMHLRERPFSFKVNLGEDPIANTIMGTDVSYQSNLPWLTKALDKLPIYSTKEMSTINAYGEVAYLKPGHQKAIQNRDGDAQVYVDDFEGTSISYPLANPPAAWKLASTPRNMPNELGQEKFPEANYISDSTYGFNRAKLAWYRIDNSFFNTQNATTKTVHNCKECISNHLVRLIPQQEIFPNRPGQTIDQNLYTFDLSYYPRQRGPYNFEASTSPTVRNGKVISYGVNTDGSLKEPQTRWGGIMRSIDNNDLEANNVEFIEFWMMDPFIYNKSSTGGKLFFHLGNVSEDILRDSRMQFENGLACDKTLMDQTQWGTVPRLPPLVNAFDNDPNVRVCQDVGLDGRTDDEERNTHNGFLQKVSSFLDAGAIQTLQTDPASDNFRFFLDGTYDNEKNILPRYKDFNNPQGNSPVQTNSNQTSAGTNLPDVEDLNRDNSLNENEEYFQYELDINPSALEDALNPYVISRLKYPAKVINGVQEPDWTWYQFRIPINAYKTRVGAIPDFKSIQFMRVALTDFQDSTTMRFGSLELVRNQWRTYLPSLSAPIDNIPSDDGGNTRFLVSAVGVEENSGKEPVNYVMPPNLQREQGIGAQTNQFIPLNESSLSTTVRGLKDGDVRAVFKNMTIDLRRYKRLKLFIHANSVPDAETGPVRDKEVTAFIRMGSDFKDNYYQYEIPLKITPDGKYNQLSESDLEVVWPAENAMNMDLKAFVELKIARNLVPGLPRDVPYSTTNADGHILTIVGNPDIGAIKTAMLGIKNPARSDKSNPLADGDDGLSKSVEVWFNEMRVAQFDEFGGAAAIGSVQIKLADLGDVNVSAAMHTRGFGQIEQKIDQRFKDDFWQYDISSTLQLGRFIPAKAGFQLPFFGGIAQTFSTPEFDPYQLDIPTKNYLKVIGETFGQDSLRKYRGQIQTITTRKGWNFSNVRIVPITKQKKPRIYDPGNFNFTYAFTEQNTTDPFIEKNSRKNYMGQIGWNFAPQAKELYPFKKLIKSKSKWLDIIRDININFIPSAMGVSNDWNRDFGEIKLRPLGETDYVIPSTYFKMFRWNRTYTLNYNPFKSLSIQYSANNASRIDEPDGLLDTKEKRDTMWSNFWKGGRNTNFTQTFSASYNLPINKIPIFDFINANIGYNSSYNWTALPQVKDLEGRWVQNPMGNTINNSQSNRGKVDLDFRKLYNKSQFLKVYNTPNPNLGDAKAIKTKKEAAIKAREKIKEDLVKLKNRKAKLKLDIQEAKADMAMDTARKRKELSRLKNELKATKQSLKQKKKDLNNKQLPSDPFISLVLRPLLMIKRASLEVRQNNNTTLPGFTGYSRLLGNDHNMQAPGYDFVFGNQPGIKLFSGFDQYDPEARDAWLDRAASKGWITRDTLLNQKFVQTRSERIDATVSIEPFTDFRIDLKLFRDKSVTHSQYFKATENLFGEVQHLNPVDIGSYSISYLPVKTMFKKIDKQGLGEVYKNFEANRPVISRRLQETNPNSAGDYKVRDSLGTEKTNENYAFGYGPKAQEVLIPSFLAAYFGGDANKVNLNPYKAIPLPNWNISYSGLNKFKWIQKVIQNISFTHGYSSTLTVSSFQSNLDYRGGSDLFGGSRVDTLNGNFFPFYSIPNISMMESFSPLIGVDITFKNNIQVRFDYKKSRNVTMNFFDYQLIEQNNEQFTIGAGYKIKGLKLPIKIKGKRVRLDNDLNFRFDFSYRDNITINHRIDESLPQITNGSRTIFINPTIDYVVSNRLNVGLFFEQTRTIPKISSGFPTTNTRGGLKLRFSLGN